MAENATPNPPPSTDLPFDRQDGTEPGQDRLVAAETRATPWQGERQAQRRQDLPQRRAIYLTLIGLFLGVFVTFASREGRGRRGSRPPIGPFDVVLLALSTFRLARIVAFEQVAEPIRAPVAESEPDGGTEPKGQGVRKALGELIACPLCIGVWISAALTYGMVLIPKPTRVFTTIFAAAGAAELLNYAVSLIDSTNRLVIQRRERLDRTDAP